MGNPFKKRTKTTVNTDVVKETQNEIVKLTYLQSLAVSGGLADVSSLAGTTSASQTEFDSGSSTNRNWAERFVKDLGKSPVKKIAGLSGGLSGLLGLAEIKGIVGGLFGKKVTTSVKGNVKDSGWQLVKTWNQPQFDIIRYAIGIKELVVSQFTYVPVSEIVSKSWTSPKEIQKVTLIVDQFIPPQFPPGTDYIKYYVKPDTDDAEWTRINPIDLPTQYDDSGHVIPRVITFNAERPISARLEDAYVKTTAPVKSIRFKAILSRPTDTDESYSPVLKSYRMLLTPLNGL